MLRVMPLERRQALWYRLRLGQYVPWDHTQDGGNAQTTAEALLKAKRDKGFTYLGHLPHRPYPPFLRRIEADPVAVERFFEKMSQRLATPADATAVAATDPSPEQKQRPASKSDSVKTCYLSVFTDGTSNDMDVDFPQGTATNVAKLYVLSKEGLDGSSFHASHYLRGVGTGQGWDVGVGKAVGLGFGERVQLALTWLAQRTAEHPQAAIVVDLFGFSRGAAEAMQLTNSLHDPAVLAAHSLSGRHLSLRFVGLFDPVAERGVPLRDQDKGADLTMHPSHARTVVSLVAVGEVRQAFNLRSLRVPPPPDASSVVTGDRGRGRRMLQFRLAGHSCIAATAVGQLARMAGPRGPLRRGGWPSSRGMGPQHASRAAPCR